MSFLQSCLLLVVATFAGWFVNPALIMLMLGPYLPKRFAGTMFTELVPGLRVRTAKAIYISMAGSYFHKNLLLPKLEDNFLALQLKPQIDTPTDAFLRNKLLQSFPMLFTLINVKTLLKFKETLMAEVQAGFIFLIEEGSKTLAQGLHAKESIEKAVLKICVPKMKKALLKHSGTVLFRVKVVGAGTGLIIWLVQCSVRTFFSLKVCIANKSIAIEMICIP